MRKSFLKAIGYFACLAWSGMACAVGFGGINVTSSLGQPLVAEIELVAVDKADRASLSARLASPDAFKGAGIDFPYALPKIKFRVETRANGEPYIKATSEQPVNEPFVSLLIELGWSSGRLLREYTFLLDPPGFVAEQPAAAAVKPIEPVVAAPVVKKPAAEPVAPVVKANVPADEPVAVAKLPPEKEVALAPAPAQQKPASNFATGSITVKRGDTLSKLAKQTKTSDVSLERMLVALYQVNADAFDGNNMNRLRVGKILHMPESQQLAGLSQSDAVNEVRAQVADWNAYRQKLAAAAAPAIAQRPKQEVAGKISTTISDRTPAAKEPAKEVLKLSKGEAPGDKAAAGGKAKSAQDKANSREEEAVAKTKAVKEAEQRTALLEKNIKDMQRLAELKSQAAASKPAQAGVVAAPASAVAAPASAVVPVVAAASSVAAASAVAPVSAVAAASSVAAVKPKVKPAAPKVVAPPPSLIDELLGNPAYLGGGAAALLGLGGLGFAFARRSKKGAQQGTSTEDVASTTGRIAAPIAPSPETGDFTNTTSTSAVDTMAGIDDVDPIGEADLFLNFGRDAQAEEVLKEALNKDPSNNPVKLKLLSIYAARKDTKSFYVYAMEIKGSNDEAAWAQAAAMGHALEPGNTEYGDGGGESSETAPAEETAAPAVDFDLGFGGDEPTLATLDIERVMEPEVPASERTVIMSATELKTAQEAPMDFDVTSTQPGVKTLAPDEPALDIPAMDFDITGTHSGIKFDAHEAPKLDMEAMDFDITGSGAHSGVKADVEEQSPALNMESPALNMDDLVFDVSPAPAPVAPAAPAPAVEADQGMAFSIDFPSEVKPEENVKPAAAKDIGLGEISLDLGDAISAPVAPAATEVKDERWQEVATKLDLAKAYQEMGDQAGAREILEEVVRDGDKTQRATAEALLQQLI